MCLAIPGKVLAIDATADPRMGEVSFAGVRKRVCLEWLPEAKVGEYVIVHVGFAISRVDEEDALETLRLLKEMGDIEEELGPPDQAGAGGPRPDRDA
jgi:hydrogenase expression/formation protein HypC